MRTGQILFYIVFILGAIFLFTHSSQVQAVEPDTPTHPFYRCNFPQGTATINWYPSSFASSYWFRLDAKPRSWSSSCNNPGDLCMTMQESSLEIPITPEVEYDWWVHAVNKDGHSSALDGQNFTCKLPIPTSLYYGCLDDNTKVRVNWDTQNGLLSERFELRFDANPETWQTDCSGEGDICMTTTNNQVEVNISPGVRYRWWIHSAQGSVWSDGVEGDIIQCGSFPSPTPTNSPTPTRTPTPSPSYTPTPTLTPTPTVTPTPSNSPVPTATHTPSPTQIPTVTPTVIQATVTPVPTGVDTCTRRSEGDADCNGRIEKNDFTCWKDFYIEKVMDIDRGCRYTDFDEFGGTNLLDYAIWYISFINEK